MLATLLPLLWLRLQLTRDDRRAFRLVQRCARRVLRWAGCRVRTISVERMSTGAHVVLVSNHSSLADAAVLLASLPLEFRFVANHVFAGYPILGAAIRAASAHIVDRQSWRSRADCGQTMVDVLRDGESLLVFPEGTTNDGPLLPFRIGAFRAAARSQRPVVPIVIHGTRDLFPNGRWTLSNVPVTVELLPPLVAENATRHGVATLRDRTAAAIAARLSGNA